MKVKTDEKELPYGRFKVAYDEEYVYMLPIGAGKGISFLDEYHKPIVAHRSGIKEIIGAPFLDELQSREHYLVANYFRDIFNPTEEEFELFCMETGFKPDIKVLRSMKACLYDLKAVEEDFIDRFWNRDVVNSMDEEEVSLFLYHSIDKCALAFMNKVNSLGAKKGTFGHLLKFKYLVGKGKNMYINKEFLDAFVLLEWTDDITGEAISSYNQSNSIFQITPEVIEMYRRSTQVGGS